MDGKRDYVQRARNAGFTLLEVMIAMAILAITLVVIFKSQSQSLSMSGGSRSTTTLCLLAQSKLADMEARETLGSDTEGGDFGTDFPGYEWHVRVTDSGVQYLKKIEVTAVDHRTAGDNAYQLVLYKISAK